MTFKDELVVIYTICPQSVVKAMCCILTTLTDIVPLASIFELWSSLWLRQQAYAVTVSLDQITHHNLIST